MLDQLDITKVLFLDIETVSQKKTYSELTETEKYLWGKKTDLLNSRNEEPVSPEEMYGRAGIYAEFGKIVCISVGYIIAGSSPVLRIKSFYGHDEKELLTNFGSLVGGHFSNPDQFLCGHNGKEFDFPYIARRMLVNGVDIPDPLNTPGKKPWEVNHLDTMELWKFGDRKNFTSLEVLAHIFNIPTPKDDIDGSEVGRVYWEEDDVERIMEYCQKDVVTTTQLMMRYMNRPLIKEENVEFVNR